MAKSRKLTDEMVIKIRAMYSTREFTMGDLATEFGVSVSTISTAIHKGYCPKPTCVVETTQRTKIIESHIMEFFDTEDEIIDTIKGLVRWHKCCSNVNQACYKMVQDGCFLIYHHAVNDFLKKKLKCKLSTNDETNWSMYKKLLVNRLVKMYERYHEDTK